MHTCVRDPRVCLRVRVRVGVDTLEIGEVNPRSCVCVGDDAEEENLTPSLSTVSRTTGLQTLAFSFRGTLKLPPQALCRMHMCTWNVVGKCQVARVRGPCCWGLHNLDTDVSFPYT